MSKSSMESTQYNPTSKSGSVEKPGLKDQCEVFSLEDGTSQRGTPNTASTAQSVHPDSRKWWNRKGASCVPSNPNSTPSKPSHMVLILALVVQIAFSVYIFGHMLSAVDTPLLFAILFLLLSLGGCVVTFQVISEKTKNMTILAMIITLALFISALTILCVISTKKNGEPIIPIERIAAVTCVIQFLSLVCLGNYFYDIFIRSKDQPLDVALPCSCRPSDDQPPKSRSLNFEHMSSRGSNGTPLASSNQTTGSDKPIFAGRLKSAERISKSSERIPRSSSERAAGGASERMQYLVNSRETTIV